MWSSLSKTCSFSHATFTQSSCSSCQCYWRRSFLDGFQVQYETSSTRCTSTGMRPSQSQRTQVALGRWQELGFHQLLRWDARRRQRQVKLVDPRQPFLTSLILFFSFYESTNRFYLVYEGTSHSYKVSKLKESTMYTFRICARNEVGEGPYSEEVAFTTTRAPPPTLKRMLIKQPEVKYWFAHYKMLQNQDRKCWIWRKRAAASCGQHTDYRYPVMAWLILSSWREPKSRSP